MRSPARITAVLVHTMLLAQAPLDLPTLGKGIDPGDCPRVYPLIPAPLQEAAEQAFGDASPASLRLAVTRARPGSNAWLLSAVAMLRHDEVLPDTEGGLADQILACEALEIRWRQERTLEQFRAAAATDGRKEVAERRRHALLARLLQDHGDGRQALLETLHCPELRVRLTEAQFEALCQRLGTGAQARDLLPQAQEWLRRDRFDRARNALAAARRWCAEHPGQGGPEPLETALRVERTLRRVAATPAPTEGGIEGDLLRLHKLQLTDRDAALDLARTLVAADAEDALPYAVVASDQFLSGNGAGALTTLDRAGKLPGKCVLYATLIYLLRMGPIVAGKELDADAKTAVTRQWQEYDKAIADDDSVEASFFRWMRDNLAIGEPWAEDAMRDLLPQAVALRDAQPDVPQFARLVFAAAARCRDRAAAREALLARLPEPLQTLPGLQLERAAALLTFAASDDVKVAAEPFTSALAEAVAAGADPREVAYLEGVANWMRAVQATAPDRAAELAQVAHGRFVAARRQPGEPGYARTEHALRLLAVVLHEEFDGPDWSRSCLQDGSPDSQRSQVPIVALHSQVAPDDPDVLRVLEEGLQREPSSGGRLILASTLASLAAARSDAEAARRASLRALQTIEGAGFKMPAPGTGVLQVAEFRYTMSVTKSRADVIVDFDNELWIVPSLPDLTILRTWADK